MIINQLSITVVLLLSVFNLHGEPSSPEVRTEFGALPSSWTVFLKAVNEGYAVNIKVPEVDSDHSNLVISGFARVVDVKLESEHLAVVLDRDYGFEYNLFRSAEKGWELVCSTKFSNMNNLRQQTLSHARLVSIEKVVLTFIKKHERFGINRERKSFAAGDSEEIYEFTSDGPVLLNGVLYSFQNKRGENYLR